MRPIGSSAAVALIAMALLAGACGNGDTTSSEAATTSTEVAAATTAPTTAPTTMASDDQDHEHGGYDSDSWPLVPRGVFLPSTFTDASGAEVTITAADRIGSMSGAVSEMLWTLGYGDRIVVIEGTTRYPEELASLPNVGFFRTLPAEGVLAQNPDVVFVPLDAGPPEALDAIAAAGVVVVRVPIDTADPASLRATAELIGAAMGDPEHAKALADDVLKAYAAAAKEPAADAPLVAYAVARGQNVFLTGLDSPSNTMIAAAGFRTVASELGLAKAVPLTPEALAAADPAVIVTTRTSVQQAGGEDAFMAMAGIAETTAGRNGALVVWEDDQSIQQWTPRAPLTVAALAEKIMAAAA